MKGGGERLKILQNVLAIALLTALGVLIFCIINPTTVAIFAIMYFWEEMGDTKTIVWLLFVIALCVKGKNVRLGRLLLKKCKEKYCRENHTNRHE